LYGACEGKGRPLKKVVSGQFVGWGFRFWSMPHGDLGKASSSYGMSESVAGFCNLGDFGNVQCA